MSERGRRVPKIPIRTDIESGSSQTTTNLEPTPDSLDISSLNFRESTTVRPLPDDVVGDKDKSTVKGRTWPDTLADMLSGGSYIKNNRLLTILVIIWVVLEVWLFIQDNGAGRLNDWQGIKWFGIKLLLTSVFVLFFMGIIMIIRFFESKPRRRTDKEM